MTGYRAFSKRFVKTIAVMSPGFQIETELTATSLQYRYNVKSIPITYRDRPEGSSSKLNTFKDGYKVIMTLFDLAKDYRPLLFFGFMALLFFVLGLVAGVPVIMEFVYTAYITKVPSAILASGLMIIAVLLVMLGLIIDHQANKEKREHELYVLNWMRNEK